MTHNPAMGLLTKLFGGKEATATGSAPLTSFQESESTEQYGSKNAPRRELVQVVLRDAMRKHGIPSDWIDSRILSVVTRRKVTGMHVQLIVRDGHDQLLAYVYAFQESFLRELEKFEPRYQEWLMSLSWQFEGKAGVVPAMPDPATWGGQAAAAAEPAAAPPSTDDDEVAEDLKALFAIRDAVLKAEPTAAEPPDFQPTQPGFVDSGKRS